MDQGEISEILYLEVLTDDLYHVEPLRAYVYNIWGVASLKVNQSSK